MYLKFVPVIVSHGSKLLQTYAILDDAAEHTIILSATAEYLELEGEAEFLALRTVRQDIARLAVASVNFFLASS